MSLVAPAKVWHGQHAACFFTALADACQDIDYELIEKLVGALDDVRTQRGRVFCIGVGGSAANSSHMSADFRRLCQIDAYALDNLAEVTACVNDDGWKMTFFNWLMLSRINANDALFVLSVGGGDWDNMISPNIVEAVDLAKNYKAKVFGVVGRAEGYTARNADICLVLPGSGSEFLTPLAESFQAVVWHCLVSHPLLQQRRTAW